MSYEFDPRRSSNSNHRGSHSNSNNNSNNWESPRPNNEGRSPAQHRHQPQRSSATRGRSPPPPPSPTPRRNGRNHNISQSAPSQTLQQVLPSNWDCPSNHDILKRRGPLHLICQPPSQGNGGRFTAVPVMVVANKSIPADVLQKMAMTLTRTEERQQRRTRQISDYDTPGNISTEPLHPTAGLRRARTSPSYDLSAGATPGASSVPLPSAYVYYFEITVKSKAPGMVWIGLVSSSEVSSSVSLRRFPGDSPGSVGLSSDGELHVCGSSKGSWTEPFRSGDVIGCGVEIGGGLRRRIFFTKNGRMPMSPSHFRGLQDLGGAQECLPAVALSTDRGEIVGNFGIRQSLAWKGSASLKLFPPEERIPQQAAATPVTKAAPAATSSEAREEAGRSRLSGLSEAASVPDIQLEALRTSTTSVQSQREEEDLREAISRSTMDTAGVPLMSLLEIQEATDCAREIMACCESAGGNQLYVKSLLTACHSYQSKVMVKLQEAMLVESSELDVDELVKLNDMLLEATEAAEKKVGNMMEAERPMTAGKVVVVAHNPSSSPSRAARKSIDQDSNGSFEVDAMVRKEDMFGLICMLRSQDRKRFDSTLALMRIARDADASSDAVRLRNEVASSGGMHSLIALFRTEDCVGELRVVAAMAVAYLLPSFVQSSSLLSSNNGLKILECLRFLTDANVLRTAERGETGPLAIYSAAAMGLTTLWVYSLLPYVNRDRVADGDDISVAISVAPSVSSRRPQRDGPMWKFRGRQVQVGDTGDIVDQSHVLQLQVLLEATISLIVDIAKIDREFLLSSAKDLEPSKSNLELRYQLVEQACALDMTRPLAVREGLLKVLVDWMKSSDRDEMNCAVTCIRHLTATLDDYMAGWIHSLIVNDGALKNIAELSVCPFVGHDVRLAVAEILSSLCYAPHTRAAVVEAKCIHYLIPLLDGYADPLSECVSFAAASALLQLLAGAMTRAAVYNAGDFKAVLTDKRDEVISDIVNGGAIEPLVAMATSGTGKLRTTAIEALRVLSQDVSPSRQTRLQLCGSGIGGALGRVLNDNVRELLTELEADGPVDENPLLMELHQALCAMSNVLDLDVGDLGSGSGFFEEAQSTLVACAVQIASSGGLRSLLNLSLLPWSNPQTQNEISALSRSDLLIEACRCLAFLSGLLLSDLASVDGYAAWSIEVLAALLRIWKQCILVDQDGNSGIALVLEVDALRGIGAHAKCEPFKSILVSKCLTDLLRTRARSDRSKVSNSANQVFVSLGFKEDEVAVQVAGNDPKLLADWFCLRRSLLIQAMAREEIRQILDQVWSGAFNQAYNNIKSHREIVSVRDLFENLVDDEESSEERKDMLQQYHDVYEREDVHRCSPELIEENLESDQHSLLCCHSFPVNKLTAERDWILSHRRFLKDMSAKTRSADLLYFPMTDRLQALLDVYFPSALLQSHVLPMLDLRPEASFNFRALALPQRRYFSFRREGQLISRLCDMDNALESDDVHWTLGFTNSSFAGEFSETLVQALYLCPTIRGISFTRNAEWEALRETLGEQDGEEGSALLANLVGSLPPGVSSLTYDNILSDRAVGALVTVLETVNKLSQGQVPGSSSAKPPSLQRGESEESVQKQGTFWTFALRNSPDLLPQTWTSFFRLLGRASKPESTLRIPPLATLRILDLSGNMLDDDSCALVLKLAHENYSGCCLEQLDISNNAIREGRSTANVLRGYVERYRYNQRAGVNIPERSWKSSLHTINMASNKLHAGSLAIEIIALLKHNALSFTSLDLSDNELGSEGYQLAEVLCGSLVKNTCLKHLNLSGNQFDSQFLQGVLERLQQSEADSNLAFLRLDRNAPPLSKNQRQMLHGFLDRSRKTVVERYLKDRERAESGISDAVDDEGSGVERFAALPETELKLLGPEKTISLGKPEVAPLKLDEEAGANSITVLFSAPLVYFDQQRTPRPFAKLDFDMERELLWQCLKEASRDIHLLFDNATHHRLLSAVTKRCSCLHYSGHGHPSYLPLENKEGDTHWLQVELLKKLIVQGGGAPFKFVFVSACYSGLAGETFASAGVPHVVCCQQESELKDAAALAFTRQFYLALAVGHTVQDAFNQGCKAVRATPNIRNPEDEMQKFVLLPKDGNHNVPVFDARQISAWPARRQSTRQLLPSKSRRGRLPQRTRSNYLGSARNSELSVRNMMQEIPSPTPPQCFIGREVDMFKVLKLVLHNRLVSVVGEPGVGRSSVVCALCHYINERNNTIEQVSRIFFVRARQGRRGDRCNALICQLRDKIIEVQKLPPPQPGMSMDMVFTDISRSLRNVAALIVFDRTELLDGADEGQDFVMFLRNLFQDTHRNVRVLLTSHHKLGIPAIGGVAERDYELGPINFADTVRLFANLCPHLHSPADRKKLLNRAVLDPDQADLYPFDSNVTSRTREIFRLLGNGIPSETEKAAYTMSIDDVAKLGLEA